MKQIENKIYPTEGMHLKYGTTIFHDWIIPAKSLTMKDFTEVTEEEYQQYLKEQEQLPEIPEDEATTEDYENALRKVGVKI